MGAAGRDQRLIKGGDLPTPTARRRRRIDAGVRVKKKKKHPRILGAHPEKEVTLSSGASRQRGEATAFPWRRCDQPDEPGGLFGALLWRRDTRESGCN